MDAQAVCPRCGVVYRDRTVCPLCYARLLPQGTAVTAAPPATPAPSAVHESPPGLIVLGMAHGFVAAAVLRVLFGVLLGFSREGTLPLWAALPVVLYLSMVAAFCVFSCFGLLSRREWAEGETRRALGLLLVLFPFGTVWGIAWFAYLKRLSRPATVVVPPPAPSPAPPGEPLGGILP